MLIRAGSRLFRALQAGPRSLTNVRNYDIKDYKPVTMDDLPVPSGSWKKAYDAQQNRYNMYLGSSVVFFIITMIVGVRTGTLDMFTGPELKNK